LSFFVFFVFFVFFDVARINHQKNRYFDLFLFFLMILLDSNPVYLTQCSGIAYSATVRLITHSGVSRAYIYSCIASNLYLRYFFFFLAVRWSRIRWSSFFFLKAALASLRLPLKGQPRTELRGGARAGRRLKKNEVHLDMNHLNLDHLTLLRIFRPRRNFMAS